MGARQIRVSRQMKPPVAFEPDTEQANLLVRIERNLKLFRQYDCHEPNSLFFHLGQTTGTAAVATSRSEVPKT